MKSIERFLNSTLYITIVYGFALVTWSIEGTNDTVTTFGLFNMIGIFVIVLFLMLSLSLFSNAKYAIPLLTSLLFVVNNSVITFDTLNTFGFPYIALVLVLMGPIIHIIRFKPKFRFHSLTLGLLLIAIAYLVPLLYTERSLKAIAISGVGLLYFFFYFFLSNTTKGDIDYFFKMLLIMNLLMVSEFGIKVIHSLIQFNDLSLVEAFKAGMQSGWGGNLGWANVNDLCYYLTLTLPGYVYFIFKKPKNIIFWCLLILPASTILLTGSRGGFMGFAIAVLGMAIIILFHGKHHQYFYGVFTIIAVALITYLSKDVLVNIYHAFIQTLDGGSINSFSSSRIWIYARGLEIFESSPWFGQGWISIDLLAAETNSRLFMYHSTIIHVLATMGVFGLIALLIHYYQVFTYIFEHWSLEMRLFLVAFIAVQIHGLVDNVQFSVPYSFLIAMLFPLLENTSVKTLFRKEGRTLLFDASLVLLPN